MGIFDIIMSFWGGAKIGVYGILSVEHVGPPLYSVL